MKLLATIFFFFLFCTAEAKNDLTTQHLKGKVRSVTNCQCPVGRNGRIDSTWCMLYVFRFNEMGNQYEDNDYSGGNLWTGFGSLNHKRIYKYDIYGRQEQVEEYNAHGKLDQKVVYIYDSLGNRVERDNYNGSGKLWFKSVFAYDDKGNKKECSKYNPDSILLEHYTYSYDTRGNLIFEQHVVMRSRIKEGSVGRNAGELVDESVRMMDYVKTFAYDDSGRLISETDNLAQMAKPLETTFKYEHYDSQGNWLKQINMERGKPTSITERIIDYYAQ